MGIQKFSGLSKELLASYSMDGKSRSFLLSRLR